MKKEPENRVPSKKPRLDDNNIEEQHIINKQVAENESKRLFAEHMRKFGTADYEPESRLF